MQVEEAAKLFYAEMLEKYKREAFSVGSDLVDTIFVYGHKRGLPKNNKNETYQGFKVVRKYIGKLTY